MSSAVARLETALGLVMLFGFLMVRCSLGSGNRRQALVQLADMRRFIGVERSEGFL